MKYSAVIVAAAAAAASAKLEPITMKGSKLFYTNGTQFFMKGVAYQQDSAAGGESTGKKTYVDPLADEKACKRDVPLLKELGTNIIRTYAIDPTADHSACMKLLDDAGIYVISDLSEPALSINRDEPKWDIELYQRYIGVVDELGQYDNVVGFFAGNEVSNNVSNTQASAFVKAAVRDTKKHIQSKFKRWLGVGYASNDDVDIREDIADYFNCGEDDSRIDYWGYNIYSWCGKSSMKDSGYTTQAEFFKDYSVPVFFAEYGCNEPDGAAGRIFDETTALYEEKVMTDVFSGGIVYMYNQEANDYGLVKISKNGDAVKLKDYAQLQKKANAANPQGVDQDDYKPTNSKAATCPSQSKTWKANSALPLSLTRLSATAWSRAEAVFPPITSRLRTSTRSLVTSAARTRRSALPSTPTLPPVSTVLTACATTSPSSPTSSMPTTRSRTTTPTPVTSRARPPPRRLRTRTLARLSSSLPTRPTRRLPLPPLLLALPLLMDLTLAARTTMSPSVLSPLPLPVPSLSATTPSAPTWLSLVLSVPVWSSCKPCF
ncbi:hypothetical protein NXS19_002543 [Fusarium pseudograminearum]|nr:hypothetical protein NXS19_002543 [Fusarium pseudograminearum]